MINYIGCLLAFAFSLLLSRIESIGEKEARIITTLGWVVALYFANAKGGSND